MRGAAWAETRAGHTALCRTAVTSLLQPTASSTGKLTSLYATATPAYSKWDSDARGRVISLPLRIKYQQCQQNWLTWLEYWGFARGCGFSRLHCTWERALDKRTAPTPSIAPLVPTKGGRRRPGCHGGRSTMQWSPGVSPVPSLGHALVMSWRLCPVQCTRGYKRAC